MKHKVLGKLLLALCLSAAIQPAKAQDTRRMYGDTARISAMSYVKSYDEALSLSRSTHKPVFFNCYAAWAGPCVGMDQFVFSNKDFARYMGEKFVNLIIDMSTDEGKKLAKKYGVYSYACYLVLDSEGNVIHRIEGGARLPEFKEWVTLALSDKTSLAGSKRRYEKGKPSADDTYNYLMALRLAGRDSLFRAIGKEYVARLSPEQLAQKRNWMLAGLFRGRHNFYFNLLIDNKDSFVKANGLRVVNNKIESMMTPELLSMASGDMEYNASLLDTINRSIAAAELPDTAPTRILSRIATLRGERKYGELIAYMDSAGHYLDPFYGVRANLELTFRFPGIGKADRERLISYLERAAKREKNRRTSSRLEVFAASLRDEGAGIKFEKEGGLAAALAKAKAGKKLVFMDCYTSWCGPCRVMSANVFTRQEVGKAFNDRFVSVKVDMEKGEGTDLAKRYGVTAFPTLLFLKADGSVVAKHVGSMSPDGLIKAADDAAKAGASTH